VLSSHCDKALLIVNVDWLQSHEWIRVRIQQMEPDLMEVGSTLEEAKQLRREHDELLTKLNVSLAHNDDFTDLTSADTRTSCVLLQTQFPSDVTMVCCQRVV